MQLHGIMLALLDIPPELTEEYNRWYDLDHLPEHVSKADVAMARRYVAPRDLHGLGAFDGERPLGLAVVDPSFEPRLAWLAFLYVSRPDRRRGSGER